jgi:hypothetical protein
MILFVLIFDLGSPFKNTSVAVPASSAPELKVLAICRGTVLCSPRLEVREGAKEWGAPMQVGHATNEPVITWWLDAERVGQSLRERYQVPEELPPKLLKLVRKLDAIEGNQLLPSSGTPPDYEQMLEARTVAGVKAFPDWFVLT